MSYPLQYHNHLITSLGISFDVTHPQSYQCGGIPQGFDIFVIKDFFENFKRTGFSDNNFLTWLHIVNDEIRLAEFETSFTFFAPDIELVVIPAWDCLPYDRSSPHKEILGKRIEAFIKIKEYQKSKKSFVVVTSVASILQFVPPQSFFDDKIIKLEKGIDQSLDQLKKLLINQGYSRVETVIESGEFASRGDILDIFPAGKDNPFRIDFFGDKVENIREFDAHSQRTIQTLDTVDLKPIGEILLDDQTVERFRQNYRQKFGSKTIDDPLYEAISQKRSYPGMEHWLSFFHDHLDTLFDYIPSAFISTDFQLDKACQNHIALIEEYYQSRLQYQQQSQGAAYYPLEPNHLYFDQKTWEQSLSNRVVLNFSPFVSNEKFNFQGQIGLSFTAQAFTAHDNDLTTINHFDRLHKYIQQHQQNTHIVICGYTAGSTDRLFHMMRDHHISCSDILNSWDDLNRISKDQVGLITLPIKQGFSCPNFILITEQDILGEKIIKPTKHKKSPEKFFNLLNHFLIDDYLVHIDHGIGQYQGLETLDIGGAPHDCLKLLYADNDKLFVPVENIDVLSRYGDADALVTLDHLGSSNWQNRKAKVKNRIREIAQDLIRIAALRELNKTDTIIPPEGIYDEFCAKFPYPETDDQLRAIEDVLTDLASGQPMDRLICGDVGFGKTEIALRAAFVVAMAGYQVAVTVPTTLLARQHFNNFTQRFAHLPIKIKQLSRLITPKEASQIKNDLKQGSIDIIVATHAILGKSIEFNRLGLMIVDEEQHFGVAQKERLKQLRSEIHVLTLTATPIPRTLQLSMAGIKQMSLIATPPLDRLAVQSFVLPYDPVMIREAIIREYKRGGKIFYVCPRIKDIDKVIDQITKLVPEIKIVVAHGQMSANELENAMRQFCDGVYDVLLSTNIVESGLDIPQANTIIIHRADMFGLAQLYQLKGRVGRTKIQGYAYFILSEEKILSKNSQKRLQIIEALDYLGAGFSIASHDLDIRGAGNLIGEEQSGNVREVGVDLYNHMLEETVNELRASSDPTVTKAATNWSPQINIGMPILIPETYIKDLNLRLNLYRRIGFLNEKEDVVNFESEMIDRFGPIPLELKNLLHVISLKQLCKIVNVDKIDVGPKGITFSFKDNYFSNPTKLIDFIHKNSSTLSLRADHKLIYRFTNTQSSEIMASEIMTIIINLLEELKTLSGT
ncbi:MAG: transcription-repair coupling factor [Alphaproteobacteria bacterium]|nr:transcription-repair coupling factor [Alphaproteobacteria bacterium]